MSAALLVRVRDAIAADAAITDFFTGRYGKPLGHLIGYDKGSPNAKDRPLFCYIAARQKYNKTTSRVLAQGSIVIQVIEKETTDGVRDGVVVADQAARLLIDFLKKSPVSDGFSDFGVVTDLGTQHPFYEIEVVFNYYYRA
ncbi:hypothetical protein [Methylovulum psychrotolerans]|uniref:DUF3168 domain-containing protein n=1 Tax=Methylovulum psychrotolerans TaxID=1704499 RepID=A0A1Z4C0I0_9GAMM|nr:hypothetical protein [Methylovulum psychrotolerans]ASF46999.1 hypothetical protein CEK71_13470 [Methylovulum psychrotolerans]